MPKKHIFLAIFQKDLANSLNLATKNKKRLLVRSQYCTPPRFASKLLLCSTPVPFSFPSILALRSIEWHPCFRDVLPRSHFVPFSFPHFFCSEEYCTPPKLDVFPFHSLRVRSFFTSDEYCTTPKLPCCVLAFPSRSPLPPSFFQLWVVVYLHATLLCFHVPLPFPFRSLVTQLSLSEESCTPSKLPCCGVMFPSRSPPRSSLVPSFLTSSVYHFLVVVSNVP